MTTRSESHPEEGPLLSVVVPVFNEKATISRVIERLAASPLVEEIIVVDDASTDGSCELLKELAARYHFHLLLHAGNRGKGASLRDGFRKATGKFVVVQDADLEYDPQDFPKLMRPILEGKVDVVYGSRLLGGGLTQQSRSYYLANRFLTLVFNLLTGCHLTDMETCYKMFRRQVLACLELREDRYGFEPEVTLEVVKRKFRILEIPISYHPRTKALGKKIGLKDGLRSLWVILARAFRRK